MSFWLLQFDHASIFQHMGVLNKENEVYRSKDNVTVCICHFDISLPKTVTYTWTDKTPKYFIFKQSCKF